MTTILNPRSLNESADFWYYDIGVNPIPADTKEKKTYESWKQWQEQSIPTTVHESRKKAGYYNNGIAIISGKIWRGPFEGKYLVAIDLDNKKAVEDFCNDGLELLKQKTLVEQTANPEKMHIYFIVEREIPNKASDKVDVRKATKMQANEFPALEVKSNGKGIMFCSNSPHQNGSNYKIIGTLKPEIFKAQEIEDRIGSICDKFGIPYGFNNGSNDYQIPITDLWKIETIILEGHNRHLQLLRIMESEVQRNKGIKPLEDIKEICKIWNQKHCDPPLDDREFEKQWKQAMEFIAKNINDYTTNTSEDNTEENSDDNNHYDQEKKKNKNIKSIADVIVQLALQNCTLFKDEYENPYSLSSINGHTDPLSINGNKFELYLSKLYYDNNDKMTANAESIKNAIRTLGAKAIFEGNTIPLYLKVAWSLNKDSIYYDLYDKQRHCVKITKGNGWKIQDNQLEVLFKRFGHQYPQLEPFTDYDPEIMDKFINSLNIKNEKHKLIIKVWIISLLIPDIAIPMLLPYGEKGSAKSTLLKKIKMVIDPSSLDLFSINHRKEEFIQQLTHNRLCFYDNVRHEPGWLSDEVCRAITGASASKRKLYSDDDDIPYRYKKILGFAGINVIFTEPDALDRAIKIELERIKEEYNIPDSKIEEELKKQIPGLLGYIFDALSRALEIKDTVSLKRLPRMADFAQWGEAISRALGYKSLEFINAYFENIGEQNKEIIEAYPLAETISKFIDYDMSSWASSPKTLIKYLKEYADKNDIDSNKFPKNETALSRRLNRIKSNLREGLGIEVIIDRITSGKGNTKVKNTTLVRIRKIVPLSPLSPLSEIYEGNDSKNSRGIISEKQNTFTNAKIHPPENKEIHSQITSDKYISGASVASGGILQNQILCHYCNHKFDSVQELLKHSLNIHPGKPAQPDPGLEELENNNAREERE